MIAVSSIQLYDLLRIKIGETEAKTLTEYIEVKVKDSFEQEKNNLASKEDVYVLKKDIAQLRIEIANSKSELLKWMIVMFAPFYVGMIVLLVKQFMW